MCDRSNNTNNSYDINQNTCYHSNRENILSKRLHNYQENDKIFLKESLTSFNTDYKNNLYRPLKTTSTKYDLISLDDIIIQDKNNYFKRYDLKKINQPILCVQIERNSNRPSKLKKTRGKRKFRKQYRIVIPRIMKKDASETTETNNERLNNHDLPNNTFLNDEFTSFNKLNILNDCHHCNSPTCSSNVSNTNTQITKNSEIYLNDHEYSFKSNPNSYENCTNSSYSSLIKDYSKSIDLTNYFQNIHSYSNLNSCCCWKKYDSCSRDCTPSKASLFVETGESVLEFSTNQISNIDQPKICPCSNDSFMIEENSTMNENVQRDGLFENEEHGKIDEYVGVRCKSKDFEYEPCCSHLTGKKRSFVENSTWNQLEKVESKPRRLDYGRRENIQWGDVGTSCNVNTVTKRPRYCESQMGNSLGTNKISNNCQRSLFGDFEIGKVWSRIHDTCKNVVQSAITNIGQVIKDISKSEDLSEDKENKISDCLSRNSMIFIGRECSESCRKRE